MKITKNYKTLLFAAGLVLSTNSINAQTQKGLDIDGLGIDESAGYSVSMPDRNTIAVGAPYNSEVGSFAGAVRIYNWNGSAWVQKGSDINGESAFDLSGYSVSMPNANTIAIGATGNDGSVNDAGHVRIFTWNGASWEQKGSDIDGEAVLDQSGFSVSMPDDNTVAIGANSNSNVNGLYAGQVRIYTWNGSSWVQKGSDIDGELADDQSGYSVSMPDANTLAIGAPGSDADGSLTDAGQVRIYEWNGSSWVQKGSDIDGEATYDQSGWSVSMPDINTVAIGAPFSDGNGSEPDAGHVRIYTWNGSSWVQKGSDIDGEASSDQSGNSVSMPDANTLAIGSPQNNGYGSVRIYTWNSSTWVQQGNDIDAAVTDFALGWSVSMPDTNTVGIGAPYNDGNGVTNSHVRVYSFCSASTGTDIVSACDSYIWIDGNTYTSSNTIATYLLTNATGCDSLVTLNLTINSVDVTVTNNIPTLTANLSGATYQWIDCNNGNTAIAGETNQSFTATTNGSFAAVVSINGCSDTTACTTFSTIGINETESTEIFIFPNPSSGLFTVNSGKTNNVVSYTIKSLEGKTIVENQLISSPIFNLDLSTQAKGIYFVSIETKEQTLLYRIIKE